MTVALPPNLPVSQPRAAPDVARLAAQRSFFAVAAGKAQAQPPAGPPPAPVATAREETAAGRLPDSAAQTPAKPLRPGSLLDIRI